METVLYIDVLFLIDFSMDTVALWLTANFMHIKTSAKRVAFAALFGAAVSTILILMSPGSVAVILTGIATAFVMCMVAFGIHSGPSMLKHTCALWFTGLLLGGMMAYLSAGHTAPYAQTTEPNAADGGIHLLPIAVFLCAVLLFFVGKISSKKTVSVEIKLFNVIVKGSGLLDSGNLLCDPISGAPVVIIAKTLSEKLLDKKDVESIISGEMDGLDDKLRPRFRTVFAKGASGETMLPCVRVDEIKIGSKHCRAIVGISDSEKFSDDITCIVPSSLV